MAVVACSRSVHTAQALSRFDYYHRPLGYHWVARIAPGTKDVVYYGVDPSNGWRVYVGPDHVYYTFKHPPPIRKADLTSRWAPHDAR